MNKKERILRQNLLARCGRIPWMILGIVAMATGVWGGLIRLPIGLPLPPDNANWITFHGPLMVCGFLGTVIGMERAVGLGRLWGYAAPVLTGAGGMMLVAGYLGRAPLLLLLAGSAVFVVMAARIIRMHRAVHTVLMALAGVAWMVGNVLWAYGWDIPRVVPWWITFLGWTIIGERLELTRYQRPVAWSRPALYAVLGIWALGMFVALLWPAAGMRLFGVGLLLSGAWLVRFDIARVTIRHTGLPHFMAVCLLGGYAWLAVAGGWLVVAAPVSAGLSYDAALHAFFLGFVFQMIFAHAPLIFPSVLLWQPLEMVGRFWIHVGLLHGSLLMRVLGDLMEWHTVRRWGAILNGVALAVFLLNTVSSMVLARVKER